ncbi:MAG: hypothetical protein ABI840_06110 [bacterium]
MNDKENIEFKNALKQRALDILEDRIKASSSAMSEAQAAANDEGRSSVGDKHQTGRAMAHIDVEIHARQLDTAQKEFAFIQKVDVSHLNNKIEIGSYADTSEGKYFFLTGLGVNDFNNDKIFYLSISSPIGKVLVGKSAGEAIIFNDKEIKIKNVF